MALSNSERQARWRTVHPEVNRERNRLWVQRARAEGRVSNGGVKYQSNPLFSFKGNSKLSQIIAKQLFTGEGNLQRIEQLKKDGVQLQAWNVGRVSKLGKFHLEKKHSCTELCRFYGHTETWIDIEPVAYKIRSPTGTFGNKFNTAFWIFKRYLVLERRLDFPEVKPIFKCERCDFTQTFVHVEDMFLFSHTCPPKPEPIDPLDRTFTLCKITEGKPGATFEELSGLWTLRKLYSFISKYHSTTGYGFSLGGGSGEVDEFWSERAMGLEEVDLTNG